MDLSKFFVPTGAHCSQEREYNEQEAKVAGRMAARLKSFFEPIGLLLAHSQSMECYYVAGSSCRPEPFNDLDLYPDGEMFNFDKIRDAAKAMSIKVLHQSKNTLTLEINGKPVQFCNYDKGGLKELVDSFDYSHVQIGVSVKMSFDGETYENSCIDEVYWTDKYVVAALDNSTMYTGSDYPLSSLVRMSKYIQRGMYQGKEWRIDILRVLRDIINRGYNDYDDFKDQLDAIDLGMVADGPEACELFRVCCLKGLVAEVEEYGVSEEEY